MPEIEYAIEVESRTSISNPTHGITNGFFRFITGRPSFVAIGENVAFDIGINGIETIEYAFSTGQLYQASNPPFKIANTVPTINMIFSVQDNSDFTGGELATAKGSAPADNDLFRVDQNGEGGIDAIPENIATFGVNGDLDVMLISTFGYLNEIATDPAVTYMGQNVWYKDFIIKKGLGTPSRSAGNGIEKTGDYGTLSGFTFSIKNTGKIWAFLEANEIYIINKEVRLYAVIDEVFYQLWAGVVKNLPRTDTKFSIECEDEFKKIHTTFPPRTITKTEFPDVNTDFIGETIPVAIGDVVYNKMLNIASQIVIQDNLPLWAYFPDGDYTGTGWETILSGVPAGGTDGKPTILIVGNLTGLDVENMYIRILQGTDLAIDVLYKALKTGVTSFNNDFISVITLDQALEGLSEQSYTYFYNNIAVDFQGEALLTEGWCQVLDVNYKHIVSNQEIKEFVLNNGLPYLLNWIEDLNAYLDISRLVIDSRTDSGGDPAYPHLKTLGRTVNDDDSLLTLSRVAPGSIDWEKVICTNSGGGQIPTPSDYKDDVDNMIDLSRNTYCDLCQVRNFKSAIAPWRMEVLIDIDVPEAITNDAVEKAYFAVDLSYAVVTGAGYSPRPGSYSVNVVGVDSFGREFEPSAESNAGFEFPGDNLGDIVLLPDSYYEGGYPGTLDSIFGNVIKDTNGDLVNMVEVLELSDNVLQPIKNGVAEKIRLKIVFYHVSPPTSVIVEFSQLRIRQIGFVIATKVDLVGNKLYTRLQGEFSTATGSIETSSVWRAFQLMLEKYDGIDPSRIDYHNMYNRGEWHVGRQIDKQKNTFDYLKELCKQSFVCMVPTREGKRRLSAWIENYFPVDVHDESEICEGSIKDYKLTPISSLYNTFNIKYAYNPARKDYDKSAFVRGLNEYPFDVLDISNWTLFVGGVDDFATANLLWGACRHAYKIAEMIQQPPEELSNLDWYIDYDIFAKTRAYSGANNSAFKFMYQLILWTAYQKGNITYQVPMNAVNVVFCELLNFITFNDAIYTDNQDWGGWIRKVKYLLNKDRIELKLIFQPRDQYEDGLIIERGDQGDDTITERGDQGDDTITEGGV